MTYHEAIDADTAGASETLYYTGLPWKHASQAKRSIAVSPTTGITYFVETSKDRDGELSVLRCGFPNMPGKPNIPLGQFTEAAVAATAAERHDFHYWRSCQERSAADVRFIGSALVSGFINGIPEYERDETADMLLGDVRLDDGRPFAVSASYFPAVKGAIKQDRNGLQMTISVAARDLPLWLLEANVGSRVRMAAVLEKDDVEDDWAERGRGALRRSFALSSDNAFHGWIARRYDRWKLIETALQKTTTHVEEAVAETLRRLIGCPTRRDLLANREAIEKLEKLDREFYLDLSRGFEPPAAG